MKTFIIFIILVCGISIGFGQNNSIKHQEAILGEMNKKIEKFPNDTQLLINAGKLCHSLALNNKMYLEKGENYFKKALSINPKLGIAKAWYGSLLTIEGKYALMPWNKLKYVQKGLLLMDDAVKSNRNNIEVRIVRGENNLALPKFFNRIDSSIVDLKFVVHELENNKDLQSKYNLGEQYLHLANAYETKGQIDHSEKIWKKITAAYPGTEEAKISNKKLAVLK